MAPLKYSVPFLFPLIEPNIYLNISQNLQMQLDLDSVEIYLMYLCLSKEANFAITNDAI